MEDRQKIGVILIVIGIPLIIISIGIFIICIGIFFLRRPKEPGWENDREQVQKSSKNLFIIGTIITILGVLITMVSFTIYNTYRVWQPHYTSNEGFARTVSEYTILLGSLIIFLGVMPIIRGVILLRRARNLIPRKRKRRLPKNEIETSRRIVDYLRTDDSGITQFRLSSVLQVDHIKLEKSLKHLERLGVIEKKKDSAEEVLLFYKKDAID
ncbi:MAG: hypothetical protein ACW98X_22425 [Promethearchaeota archaeon]|jgi:hypothetical protein